MLQAWTRRAPLSLLLFTEGVCLLLFTEGICPSGIVLLSFKPFTPDKWTKKWSFRTGRWMPIVKSYHTLDTIVRIFYIGFLIAVLLILLPHFVSWELEANPWSPSQLGLLHGVLYNMHLSTKNGAHLLNSFDSFLCNLVRPSWSMGTVKNDNQANV